MIDGIYYHMVLKKVVIYLHSPTVIMGNILTTHTHIGPCDLDKQ